MELGMAIGLTMASMAFSPTGTEEPPSRKAEGRFEVTITPIDEKDPDTDANLGRMALHKIFTGDLTGESKGTMLTAMTATKGSAGYVAIEKFSGTLAGREGSFVLQHSGTMSAAGQSLTITVVPDSGTGDLEGISGSMTIAIEEGVHSYSFTYGL